MAEDHRDQTKKKMAEDHRDQTKKKIAEDHRDQTKKKIAEDSSSSESIIVDVVGDTNQSALFGKYNLGSFLGSGAFAKVYQAEDLHNNGKSVAIKVIQKKRLKDGLTANIKREISVMRRLHHPHIVLLSEVLATKTKIYLVMELAKGGELFFRVKSHRFTERLSRKYFRQLISAVEYCHARGVFHRDLKPENLLLDENRDLKVSDFGLSAMREQIHADGMLHTLCGTPAYVAPELLLKKGYDGSKVDIWSCGVVLFVLNAGYLPFSDPNISGLYRKIRKGEYKMPDKTSKDLTQLLSRLLEPDPEKRITVEGILKDPWFNHGVDPNEIIGIQADDYDLEENGKKLNAFELIASASTSNLAGLFGSFVTPDHCDQFVSDETPVEIMRKVVEAAKLLNLRIAKKKDRAIKLEGLKGVANIVVKIRRLTDELVMVEMMNKQRDVGLVWADDLRQRLRRSINQPVYRGK